MTDLIKDALVRLEKLKVEADDMSAPAPVGAEDTVDAVMVRRGWAKQNGAQWGDGPLLWSVRPVVPNDPDYARRRAQVAREIENAKRGAADVAVTTAVVCMRAIMAAGEKNVSKAARLACDELARQGVHVEPATARARHYRKK